MGNVHPSNISHLLQLHQRMNMEKKKKDILLFLLLFCLIFIGLSYFKLFDSYKQRWYNFWHSDFKVRRCAHPKFKKLTDSNLPDKMSIYLCVYKCIINPVCLCGFQMITYIHKRVR